mmetsp:Transcript_41030/g.30180  ORF Transcript_41030/g.30180 Transcript_41030/m.30180 type:complete len:81 (+) Transcript_41030:727-969(+)
MKQSVSSSTQFQGGQPGFVVLDELLKQSSQKKQPSNGKTTKSIESQKQYQSKASVNVMERSVAEASQTFGVTSSAKNRYA